MTQSQKLVAFATLILVALFLHLFLCDWLGSSVEHNSSEISRITIVPFGHTAAIVARSSTTLLIDALLGVAVPMLLTGASLFVFATPTRDREAGGPVN
ncbi:hypothetical protein NHH03_03325 [Stieleria sp. TO1_6]|uniref:hypothetical protein n=1 Tax=Stieleria tagensis TaxID=2956795 RepID=UPI00209B89B9|nr:hypothetical protein [Stieleria tagensis]MCO8120755.1 hypothetical protein [Stieleria tagensis]